MLHNHVDGQMILVKLSILIFLILLLRAKGHLVPHGQTFLNQARAWFLRIASVRESMRVCVCVCVCLPPRLLITSGVMWCDIDPIRLVK